MPFDDINFFWIGSYNAIFMRLCQPVSNFLGECTYGVINCSDFWSEDCFNACFFKNLTICSLDVSFAFIKLSLRK